MENSARMVRGMKILCGIATDGRKNITAVQTNSNAAARILLDLSIGFITGRIISTNIAILARLSQKWKLKNSDFVVIGKRLRDYVFAFGTFFSQIHFGSILRKGSLFYRGALFCVSMSLFGKKGNNGVNVLSLCIIMLYICPRMQLE